MAEAEPGDRRLAVICAFDVAEDGRATAVEEARPAPTGPARYRWLHFDLAGEGVRDWTEANTGALAAATLLAPQTRPRCAEMEGGVALNLRGVNLNVGKDEEDMVSVRVWACDRTVVSMQLQTVFAIRDLREAAEAGAAPPHPAAWIAALADRLTARIEDETVALGEETEAIEDRAEADEPGLGAALTALRRKAAKMRRFLAPQRDALAKLYAFDAPPLAGAERPALTETANRAVRALEELDAVRERLTVVADQLAQRRSEEMDRNSYVLSVVAAIFLPLGFLTGLLGVNVAGIPGVEWPYAFWALTAGVALIGVAIYWWFKRKGWI